MRRASNLVTALATALATAARRALHEVTGGASDVDGLPLATLLDRVELDVLALHQAAEALRVDGALVHEEVLAARHGRDEAEALLDVEPLDRADGLALARRLALGPLARRLVAAPAALALAARVALHRAAARCAHVGGLRLAAVLDRVVRHVLALGLLVEVCWLQGSVTEPSANPTGQLPRRV